ncbi:hypothetical protein ACFQJD_13655 [Haloplanus sp. GCM10025708]|uniref:hypothetical protein n=1 Tax=Haloferacaceae TaxID=1644056 RepID=UPI00360C8CB7
MLHVGAEQGARTALDLPLSPGVALGILAVGLVVLAVVAYDAYRSYREVVA